MSASSRILLRFSSFVCIYVPASWSSGGLLPIGPEAESRAAQPGLGRHPAAPVHVYSRRVRPVARCWVTWPLLQPPEAECPQTEILAICGDGLLAKGRKLLHGRRSQHKQEAWKATLPVRALQHRNTTRSRSIFWSHPLRAG